MSIGSTYLLAASLTTLLQVFVQLVGSCGSVKAGGYDNSGPDSCCIELGCAYPGPTMTAKIIKRKPTIVRIDRAVITKARGPDGRDLGSAKWIVNGKIVWTTELHKT